MQSSQWERAHLYVSRAKKLPRNLVSSKKKLMVTLKRRIREMRRGLVTPGIGQQVIVPRPPQYQPPYPYPVESGAPPQGQQIAGSAKESKPQPPPEPTSGFQTSISPSFSVVQKQKSLSYHGFQDEQQESSETVIGVGFTGRYDASPLSSGGQPYLQAQIHINQTNKSSNGQKVKYVAPSDDLTGLREESVPIESTEGRAANFKVVPEAGYPIADFLDLTGSYTLEESYPDGLADEKTGTRTPFASADITAAGASLKLSFSQKEAYNAEGLVTATSTTFQGDLEKSFDSLSLGGSVAQTTASPSTDAKIPEVALTIKGEASKAWETFTLSAAATSSTFTPFAGKVKLLEQGQTIFEMSAARTFEFGGSLNVTGKMVQKTDLITEHSDPKAEVAGGEEAPKLAMKSQATEQSVTSTFSLTPISWLTGSLSYMVQMNEFRVGDPRFALDFEQKNPEIINEFQIKAALSTSF